MVVPASASASDFTSCCFRVAANAYGEVSADWGSDQKGYLDGTHNAYWSWYSRQLMGYRLHEDKPRLFPACYKLNNGRSRCSPIKGTAHLGESSHFVEYPGDPNFRYDYGSCTNDVYSGGVPTGEIPDWVSAKTSPVNLLPASSNDAGREVLELEATMGTPVPATWDEECWFGIGSHSANAHEHGEDPSNEFVNNRAWEGYLDAPGPSCFRKFGAFQVGGDTPFSHNESSPESKGQEGPHQFNSTNSFTVRFTPFSPARLPREIEKLKRLKEGAPSVIYPLKECPSS